MPVFAVTTAKGANWDHSRDIPPSHDPSSRKPVALSF